MKHKLLTFIIVCFSVCICYAKDPSETKTTQIFKLESEGNLESTHSVGCIDIKKLNNKYTPADLYPAVVKCVKESDYDNAFALFMMAGVYGYFDEERVTDKSAHQAKAVLIMNNMSTLTNEEREIWKKEMGSNLAENSPKLAQVCSEIKQIGYPEYYPSYMIQHGISAFTGSNKTPLKTDFNPGETWKKALTDFLHCPTT